jgi:hypothetical protein
MSIKPVKPMTNMISKRRQSGLLVYILPAVILMVGAGLAALGTDIAHGVDCRSELQNATDAGALSGAQDLFIPNNNAQAISDALSTASLNTADGRSVSKNSPNTTVSANILNPANANILGQCQCNASMQVQNYFAKMFGMYNQTVNTTSTATAYKSLTAVDPGILFPLAVSIDTLKGHTVPLYQNKVGDTVTFNIESQQVDNSAWTSLSVAHPNANWIDQAIDSALGINFVPGLIPGVSIGDQIGLMNGVAGTKDLSGSNPENSALLSQIVCLPVIQGDSPYNQTTPLIGWITVQITKVTKNMGKGKVLQFTATIVKGIEKGTPGQIVTGGNSQITSALNALSPGTVELTQ